MEIYKRFTINIINSKYNNGLLINGWKQYMHYNFCDRTLVHHINNKNNVTSYIWDKHSKLDYRAEYTDGYKNGLCCIWYKSGKVYSVRLYIHEYIYLECIWYLGGILMSINCQLMN